MLLKKIVIAVFMVLMASGVLEAARLNVFVNIDHPLSSEARFKVISLSLVDAQGSDVPVDVANPVVTTRVPFGQCFLASAEVPEGQYAAVALKVGGIRMGERKIAGEQEVKVAVNWELKEGESRCLFLVWDVRGSLREKGFAPSFYGMPQSRPLRGETLYVTCDEINTLFAIRTDRNRVVASLATKDTPRQLVAFSRGDRLYVLCERSRSLLSVEMSTFRIIDSLLLPMVQSPRFMALVNGRTLAITDPSNDQIFLVDASTGSLLKSKRLGHRLSDVIYWEEGRQLFVSSTGGQKVYQLNTDLSLARAYDTGSSPRGLWVQREWLYVADSGSGTVSLFNLRNGRLVGRIRSGREPIYLMGTQRRLYVSNRGEGTLGVFWPRQMAISQRIRVGGTPSMLAICTVRRWIYAVDRSVKGLVAVNATSLKKEGTIILGNLPYGLVVVR